MQGPSWSWACRSSSLRTSSVLGAREVMWPRSVREIRPASAPGTVSTATATIWARVRSRSVMLRPASMDCAASRRAATRTSVRSRASVRSGCMSGTAFTRRHGVQHDMSLCWRGSRDGHALRSAPAQIRRWDAHEQQGHRERMATETCAPRDESGRVFDRGRHRTRSHRPLSRPSAAECHAGPSVRAAALLQCSPGRVSVFPRGAARSRFRRLNNPAAETAHPRHARPIITSRSGVASSPAWSAGRATRIGAPQR